MSRLIEADALIKELHHMIEGDADLRKDYEYMGIDDCIRSMPTAFDVDKVVEELETEVIALEDNYGELVECIPVNIVRDIVRKGGVHDY